MRRRDAVEAAIDELVEGPDGGSVWIHEPGCRDQLDGDLCPCRPRRLVVPPRSIGRVLSWLAWGLRRGHR